MVEDRVVSRLTTLPGIGPITASAYVAALDDAARFGGAAQVRAAQCASVCASFVGALPPFQREQQEGNIVAGNESALLKAAKPGSEARISPRSGVVFTNPDDPGTPWRNEHAIKLGDDLYLAHGVSNQPVTRREILDRMVAEHVSRQKKLGDVPATRSRRFRSAVSSGMRPSDVRVAAWLAASRPPEVACRSSAPAWVAAVKRGPRTLTRCETVLICAVRKGRGRSNGRGPGVA